MKRHYLHFLFMAVFLSLISISGCFTSRTVRGIAFTVDEKGMSHPLADDKITVYRGDLPQKLSKSFPWCNEDLLLRTARETAKKTEYGCLLPTSHRICRMLLSQ